MKTRLVLKPGDRGTRKVVDEFGGKLVCVRYRYDEEHRRRLKTAEIILEEVPWEPAGGEGPKTEGTQAVGSSRGLVRIRVRYEDREIRRLVKDAGGQWLSGLRLWEVELGVVRRLGLEGRIVVGDDECGASTGRYQG
jgi:hypothetical protein